MNKLMGAAWLGASLTAVVMTMPVQAQEPYKEMRPYLSGMFRYVFEYDDRDELVGGSNEGIEEGKGLQLGVGKALSEHFGLELSAFHTHFGRESNSGHSVREYGAKLDGLLFYSRNPRFSPYFGIGVGAAEYYIKDFRSNGGGDPTDPFADAGFGFMKFFEVAGTEFGIRSDLRYRWIFTDDDKNLNGNLFDNNVEEVILTVGMVVPLGAKPVPPPVPVPPPGPCADADGDGVCDDADLCPDTPKGVAVDAKGCPPEPKADDTGGPNRQFEDVHFAFDRSELTDYAKALLDNAANVINQLATKYPTLKVDLGGHTDWVGTDGYNLGLSERRANVVKQYLLRKGIEAGRITTQAYGESRPKATNETDEGRAINRRTEVRTRER